MYRKILQNHVLANLTFCLVLMMGAIAYFNLMPRAKDPNINFNWVNITTSLPGASASDIEKRITDPLEDALNRSVQDINFVSSTSREGISNIVVRFHDVSRTIFDKRIADLRREVQNTFTDQLPEEANDPFILELTTSSAFPTAAVLVKSLGADENLRKAALNIQKKIDRIDGVDSVVPIGLYDPELHVSFYPERLSSLGITPGDLADTIQSYFRDVSIGDLETNNGNWVVSLVGTDSDPEALADFPILTANGVVVLSSLADTYLSTREPEQLVSIDGEPSVLLNISKTGDANILDLIKDVRAFVDEQNNFSSATGIELVLVDDQTDSTRSALGVMTNNMIVGLVLVMIVTWLFLGSRIAFFTCIGIPFTLAGTFIVLHVMGMSINNMVLLGVVISLGMLVDDAVVVVESIYYRIQRGFSSIDASIDALREVFAPVTASVLTTIAAFLPLVLLEGIMGDFMSVVPITVTVALLISLIEAYWMLPAHISAAKVSFERPSKFQIKRDRATKKLRLNYTRFLLKSMRKPLVTSIVLLTVVLMGFASFLVIKKDFFTFDPIRNFYVSVEMPAGTSLAKTLEEVSRVEVLTKEVIDTDEIRSALGFSGQQFTQMEPLFGENIGQVQVSLLPKVKGGRSVSEIIDAVDERLQSLETDAQITFLPLEDGPPSGKPISLKLLGDNYDELKRAADELMQFMAEDRRFKNTNLDYRAGNPQLLLKHNGEAIKRAGLSPTQVTRAIQAYVDGEIVAQFQSYGEEVWVRLKSNIDPAADIDQLLRQTISLPNGNAMAIGDLVTAEYGNSLRVIRHYNYQRAITIESDILSEQIDTISANQLIMQQWELMQLNYPSLSIDFSGELDDILESMNSIAFLFVFGIGLIYIILGTQFKSYWQPFLVIATIPMAISGVFLGLALTQNPLSLYTMYGIVALIGIAVNASIVLISAANDRLKAGMSVTHAIVYAARRRVIPILITTATTIAGLFSLAIGLAGHSLMWGPIATSIVFGLTVSSALTLFVIPLLYRVVMQAALGR